MKLPLRFQSCVIDGFKYYSKALLLIEGGHFSDDLCDLQKKFKEDGCLFSDIVTNYLAHRIKVIKDYEKRTGYDTCICIRGAYRLYKLKETKGKSLDPSTCQSAKDLKSCCDTLSSLNPYKYVCNKFGKPALDKTLPLCTQVTTSLAPVLSIIQGKRGR